MIGVLISPWCFDGVDDNLLEHVLNFFVMIMLLDVLNQLMMRNGFVIRFNIRTNDVLGVLCSKHVLNPLGGELHTTWPMKMVAIGIHHVLKRWL